ncbi:MAG: hypothetical protein RI897_2721 [Verrucomicrobiota bacterium]
MGRQGATGGGWLALAGLGEGEDCEVGEEADEAGVEAQGFAWDEVVGSEGAAEDEEEGGGEAGDEA